MNVPVSVQAATLLGVSHKYNIPLQALLGIYGQETSYGRNVTTSSTGAQGPFQFEPSTATQFNYPLTNTPTVAQFEQQADAWGQYLVANNPSHSATGWAPAMKGGYTETQAESNNANLPADLKEALSAALLNATAGAPTGTDAGSALSGTGVSITGPGGIAGALDSAADTVGNVVSSAAVLGTIWTFLTTPANWLRIFEGLGGIVLLFLGIRELAGGSA